MRVVNSINTLNDIHFKSCNPNGQRDLPGNVREKTESSIPVNNIRGYDHVFLLFLHLLSREQIKDINEELKEIEKESSKAIILEEKISHHGYTNYKPLGGDPHFNFSTLDIKERRMPGTDFWTMSITLIERIGV